MKTRCVSLSLLLLYTLIFLAPSFPLSAQEGIQWRDLTNVEDVCQAYPERMNAMLAELNLDLPGLESTKHAASQNDLAGACQALLGYYKKGTSGHFLRKKAPIISNNTTSKGDSIIQDIYTFQLVGDRVPRYDDGHLNWDYTGPEDDIEWAWALNRHYPINELLRIYFDTGNAKYAQYIDAFIKDWIIHSLPYPGVKSSTAMWRGLEVSFRVKVWSQVFYGLMDTEYLSDATKLLILSSLPEHSHYARNFHAQNNWLTMEMSGLANVAVAWPEYSESDKWLEYAINTMTESMKEQVYSDGAQTELTSSYHYVALNNFLQLQNICKAAGKELPEFYTSTIEKMYNYLALTISPDGHGLLNNDADRISNKDIILKAINDYNRPDWEYIATNGHRGILPSEGPSFMFPWAGHLVSRSGFDEKAHWSFFDIGPWGSGHQHNDKMHVSISAFGFDFLVDAGRFAYRGEVAEKFRRYAKGTQGHNVLLFDGKGQADGPLLTDHVLPTSHYAITDKFDYAWASFDKFNDLDGSVDHVRTLLYVRDHFWVIVDKVTTDKPRQVTALWHWHPECDVITENINKSIATNADGNLELIPVGKTNWSVSHVRGQEVPEIQGWYSKEYNQFEPNTTSIYNVDIKGSSTFVWLIVPSEKEPSGISARIIKVDANKLKLQVKRTNKNIWDIELPFKNSLGVNVSMSQSK